MDQEIEGRLVDLGEVPLDELLLMAADDSVLANSIRHIVNAAKQTGETVAAFSNYV
jgi:FXSXX-COOH protein